MGSILYHYVKIGLKETFMCLRPSIMKKLESKKTI